MAIIYSYPELPFNKLTGGDLFVITDVDSTTDNPTRSLSLNNVVKYIKESAGTGTGTANRIPVFKTTGASVLTDSIMIENSQPGILIQGNLDIFGKFVQAQIGVQNQFAGQVTIPLTPVATTDAASKGYVDGLTARKIFTATSLDTTTNYNTVAATPIVWDSELIKDSVYTHDSANTPTQVTVTEAGTYRVYSMLTATTLPVGTGQRVNVSLRIAVNGTATGRLGAGMYIRGQTGITESSATIEETMVLNANDIITITGERGSNASANTFNVSGASFFSIEKIA